MAVEASKLDELCEFLRGTCNSLTETWVLFPEIAEEDREAYEAAMEEHVFLCGVCGWWEHVWESEEDDSGERVCTDCI